MAAKQHTTYQFQVESIAIQLYLDNLRHQPTIQVPRDHPMEQGVDLVNEPTPRWSQVGLEIRNAYRAAAKELMAEVK